MYQLANPDENAEEPPPTKFGDLRVELNCEYVGEVIKTTGEAIIGAGSHRYIHRREASNSTQVTNGY